MTATMSILSVKLPGESLKMTELDDAMMQHMRYIVLTKKRPFSYRDFCSFEVNDKEYGMEHGTFRNKVSQLMKIGEVQLEYKTSIAFYTIKGVNFGKRKHNSARTMTQSMTPNHMGVYSCHCCHYHHQHGNSHDKAVTAADAATTIATRHHTLYSLIQDLPLDKRSLHDIRLRFEIPDIHTILSSSLNDPNFQQQQLRLNSNSEDIVLPTWNINDLNIKVTVHRTNTVSVIVGCSYAPIAADFGGVIRLTNALARVEERISRLLDDCGKIIPGGYESLPIPEHTKWMVTMWHFGADASIEYAGEKFSATWNVGENALIRAYSKVMKDGKARIRLERQEYPGKSLADAIEEKLYSNDAGGGSDTY
jgi:hypothetical protein